MLCFLDYLMFRDWKFLLYRLSLQCLHYRLFRLFRVNPFYQPNMWVQRRLELRQYLHFRLIPLFPVNPSYLPNMREQRPQGWRLYPRYRLILLFLLHHTYRAM